MPTPHPPTPALSFCSSPAQSWNCVLSLFCSPAAEHDRKSKFLLEPIKTQAGGLCLLFLLKIPEVADPNVLLPFCPQTHLEHTLSLNVALLPTLPRAHLIVFCRKKNLSFPSLSFSASPREEVPFLKQAIPFSPPQLPQPSLAYISHLPLSLSDPPSPAIRLGHLLLSQVLFLYSSFALPSKCIERGPDISNCFPAHSSLAPYLLPHLARLTKDLSNPRGKTSPLSLTP